MNEVPDDAIVISSLQDLISLLEEHEGKYYFRGESKNYGKTRNMSSGYRWMEDNNKVFMDLLKMRQEFFREVGVKLSLKEIENFLSYSQHHGLPTELLDITANPLVALYFACEANQETEGFLYFFNNSVYDARTDGFNPIQFQNSPYHDLTQELFSEDISKQHIWFRWHEVIDDDMIQKVLMENENQYICDLFQDSDILAIQQKNEEAWEEYSDTNREFAKLIPGISELMSRFHCSEGTFEDKLSRRYESAISFSFRLINLTGGEYFPKLRYLLVKPTVIFDRMKNQQGLFIYQLTTSLGDDKGCFQPIVPEFTMRIPAISKRRILKQLDLIGINKKFLYSDDDSIAEYLENNYDESFYKQIHPLG